MKQTLENSPPKPHTPRHSLESGQACTPDDTFGIHSWGKDFFGVSPRGVVTLRDPTGRHEVELTSIIEGLEQRGLDLPVMLRVENLLDHRIRELHKSFHKAIQVSNYQAPYRGVFPIKVNQQKHVIQQICELGNEFGHGLEAGSKAELLIAISQVTNKESLIVCNGFKDEEFVDLGLQSQKIGFQCIFVIESPSELETVLARAEHWGIEPLLGVRLKLTTKVEGHWANDSGDRSLFGLTPPQLVDVVDRLKAVGKLNSLKMLHFHLGSQIPSIKNMRDGVAEACRYYIELVNEGVPLCYLNLGGGLAVDYDGSNSPTVHSRDYELDEYCIDIVERIMDSLDPAGVPHPCIVTESGRWTVAPMSILLFDIISVGRFHDQAVIDEARKCNVRSVQRLVDIFDHIEDRRLQENLNDIQYYREQLRRNFQEGKASLRERAIGEKLCISLLNRVELMTRKKDKPAAPLLEVQDAIADIYYGNFSVFQSLPDAWAIDQVFPVMPIHRLNETPSKNAIIADVTCDCDGKLDRFIDPEGGFRKTIRLHPIQDGERYILGVFLVGAYQETLGDLHNLFGDTHVATIRIDEQGDVEFIHELHGDSIADVLAYVEYDPKTMADQFRSLAESAVKEKRITVQERQKMVTLFQDSLRGYTYFE